MEKQHQPENLFEDKEKAPSVMEEPNIRRFIERRGIQHDDFIIIEALAEFPNNLITMLAHNLFNSNQERSDEALERIISTTKDNDYKRVYDLFLQLLKKYDWATCYNLVGILEERREKTQPLIKWEIERKK